MKDYAFTVYSNKDGETEQGSCSDDGKGLTQNEKYMNPHPEVCFRWQLACSYYNLWYCRTCLIWRKMENPLFLCLARHKINL